MEWNSALEKLKKGNANFKNNQLVGGNSNSDRRSELLTGQQPWAVILSCADSRVVPELIFDTGMGELFVIRVAGNIANSSSVASIEYAIAHLGTKLIVVMGHQSCGAVGAAIAGKIESDSLGHLIEHISPSIALADSSDVNDVVKSNARKSASDIISISPIIDAAVRNNGVKIVPAYYEFSSGNVEFLS